MRIGLDMLAAQSPESQVRGIGRYTHHFAAALLEEGSGHEFIAFTHRGLSTGGLPSLDGARIREIGPDESAGETTVGHRFDRLVRRNREGLDAIVIPSPFEMWGGYAPPARCPRGPLMSAVVHDMIPLIFQDQYLAKENTRRWFERGLWTLQQYDVLFTNSEATREDCLARLSARADQVRTIGTASDPDKFWPDDSEPMPPAARSALRKLGVRRRYIFCVGGDDPRKNMHGLISAFALLSESERATYQLVIACRLDESWGESLSRHAAALGVRGSLVFTGGVSDSELRLLYQRCAVFAFPSLYEGFGLPLLEAMHCGAVVVAGDNSAQPEVVGDGGLLVDAANPRSVADALARVLRDPSLARDLRSKALVQSERFSWRETAKHALEAIEERFERRNRARRSMRAPLRARPRIAMLSPFPPARSGIADYSDALIEQLDRTYEVDRYHEQNFVPDPAWSRRGSLCADARIFPRVGRARDYRGIVYQMGNSQFHTFLYSHLIKMPGITTLHEMNLAGFHFVRALETGAPRETLAEELEYDAGEVGIELARQLETSDLNSDAFAAECQKRGIALCRRVIEKSWRVLVHSESNVATLAKCYPELSDRIELVPHGATARRLNQARLHEIRDRFQFPRDGLLLVSLGIVHPTKLNAATLEAFVSLAAEWPKAQLIFAGEELDGGALRAAVTASKAADRVRVLGRVSASDYADLAAIADVGINLRKPPTRGESSASLLDFLRHGIATVVTDTGSFRDYNDDVVRKVEWPTDGEGLVNLGWALSELMGSTEARRVLGRSALSFVDRERDWRRVAERYSQVIEACHASREASAA